MAKGTTRHRVRTDHSDSEGIRDLLSTRYCAVNRITGTDLLLPDGTVRRGEADGERRRRKETMCACPRAGGRLHGIALLGMISSMPCWGHGPTPLNSLQFGFSFSVAITYPASSWQASCRDVRSAALAQEKHHFLTPFIWLRLISRSESELCWLLCWVH